MLVEADTIRILVSTDSHVGYNERDPVRGDDSWKSFDEVMRLARERDVDMVLLAGDLFHENKPSRKSMYQVMRSLRANCYGDRPCELELLSDASENFQGAFNHVNYEDYDINVAIPVFSIHGNHDDPSGEGHLAALDILQVAGLLNYFGRTPESDNIQVRPVLIQKGRTKMALYGMSNVRDERLFRTFRDGKVSFFQPSMQKSDWFNLMCVHQNHHARTETGYLPETFLPEFLDLVVWGHEHECLIDPRLNPEMNFHVMQPGSSVATSLVPGEAAPKHVALLTLTGRDFKTEPIKLRSVRPFVMREIVLHAEKEAKKLARKENNRTEVTRFLMTVVDDLIEEAKNEWLESRNDEEEEGEEECPLPLVRLRVEISTPEGGSFDCENPQRFSNRFIGKVANVNDVVQFYRKKKTASSLSRAQEAADAPDASAVAQLATLDTVKVERLVREFLTAQSLTILPQNSFGDAVSQFVDKDDKHAMEMFVNDSLESQLKHLLNLDRGDGEEGGGSGGGGAAYADKDDGAGESALQAAMDKYRGQLEEMFSRGKGRTGKHGKKRFKPKPDGWDSEFDGPWEDQPGALIHSDDNDENEGGGQGDREDQEEAQAPASTTRRRGAAGTTTSASTRGGRSRGTGRARGGTTTTNTSTRGGRQTGGTKTATTPTSRGGRRKQQAVTVSDDEENDNDVDMFDDIAEERPAATAQNDGEDNEEDSLFVRDSQPPASRSKAPTSTASTSRSTRKQQPRSAASASASSKSKQQQQQATLSFPTSQSQTLSAGRGGGGGGSGVGKRPTRGAAAKAKSNVISDDEIDDDDDDAFEPAPPPSGRRRR